MTKMLKQERLENGRYADLPTPFGMTHAVVSWNDGRPIVEWRRSLFDAIDRIKSSDG